jgi:hypothetical protein
MAMTLRVFVLAAALVVPASATAQTPLSSSSSVDPRWAPWLGCWDLRTENLTEGDVDPVIAAARRALPNTRARGVMVCVTTTASPAEIRQQTVADDEVLLEETVAADGVERPVQDATCRGTRAAEWSSTGRQLFTRGTLTCDGQPKRTISGTTFMVPGPTWVDVQLVDVEGRRSVRIRRYGPSRDQTRVDGRSAVTARSTALVDRFAIEEVKEAARKVAPEVVQASLVEVGAKFPLNRERLVELDRAKVPGSVVDVMMALSFPDRFVLERASSGGSGGGGVWGGWGADPWAIASPLAYLSLYAPFGYQYYGYYDPTWGGPGSGWIIVNPGPSEPAGPEGRAVNGLGYTRITPREPTPVRVNSDGSIVDRSGGGAGSGSGSNGGSNNGGGATSGGYSSGGGGGSGRTAQPRPPGGR